MQNVLEVPDSLGEKLQAYHDRLPELLDRALEEFSSIASISFSDELQIIELLASQPTPKEILAIRPTPALQERMSQLLTDNKTRQLSRQEEAEIDRYLVMEHLVRLAKASAYKRL
ncbi:hypothetical protein LEP3755_35520 [Leptolyngbya sp. NIES-3755]|nr:hypothetical protein LEP3755_35520 [Leptolyngbya sp. NIES-3755]